MTSIDLQAPTNAMTPGVASKGEVSSMRPVLDGNFGIPGSRLFSCRTFPPIVPAGLVCGDRPCHMDAIRVQNSPESL